MKSEDNKNEVFLQELYKRLDRSKPTFVFESLTEDNKTEWLNELKESFVIVVPITGSTKSLFKQLKRESQSNAKLAGGIILFDNVYITFLKNNYIAFGANKTAIELYLKSKKLNKSETEDTKKIKKAIHNNFTKRFSLVINPYVIDSLMPMLEMATSSKEKDSPLLNDLVDIAKSLDFATAYYEDNGKFIEISIDLLLTDTKYIKKIFSIEKKGGKITLPKKPDISAQLTLSDGFTSQLLNEAELTEKLDDTMPKQIISVLTQVISGEYKVYMYKKQNPQDKKEKEEIGASTGKKNAIKDKGEDYDMLIFIGSKSKDKAEVLFSLIEVAQTDDFYPKKLIIENKTVYQIQDSPTNDKSVFIIIENDYLVVSSTEAIMTAYIKKSDNNIQDELEKEKFGTGEVFFSINIQDNDIIEKAAESLENLNYNLQSIYLQLSINDNQKAFNIYMKIKGTKLKGGKGVELKFLK